MFYSLFAPYKLFSVNWVRGLVRFKTGSASGIHHRPHSKQTFGFPSAQNQPLCWHWSTESQDQRHFHVPLPRSDLQRKNIPGSWAGIPARTGLECSHSSSCQRAKSFSSKIISPLTGFFSWSHWIWVDHRAIVWVRPWCLCNSYTKLSVKAAGV